MSLVDVFDTIGSNKLLETVFLYFIYFLFQYKCGIFLVCLYVFVIFLYMEDIYKVFYWAH